jgi:hypothetical protein
MDIFKLLFTDSADIAQFLFGAIGGCLGELVRNSRNGQQGWKKIIFNIVVWTLCGAFFSLAVDLVSSQAFFAGMFAPLVYEAFDKLAPSFINKITTAFGVKTNGNNIVANSNVPIGGDTIQQADGK